MDYILGLYDMMKQDFGEERKKKRRKKKQNSRHNKSHPVPIRTIPVTLIIPVTPILLIKVISISLQPSYSVKQELVTTMHFLQLQLLL